MITTIVAELGGLDPAEFASHLGGGARPPVRRGRPAAARGRSRPAARPRPRPAARACPRRRASGVGRRGGRAPCRPRPRSPCAVEAYSRAFVELVPVPAEVGPLLERLASASTSRSCRTGRSPSTIDAYVEAAGWRPWLRAIVVSQRVGTIKPDPRIFRVAEDGPRGSRARRSSTSATTGRPTSSARNRPAGGRLPPRSAGWIATAVVERPDASVAADLEIDTLAELEAALAGTSGRAERCSPPAGAVRLAGGWIPATD